MNCKYSLQLNFIPLKKKSDITSCWWVSQWHHTCMNGIVNLDKSDYSLDNTVELLSHWLTVKYSCRIVLHNKTESLNVRRSAVCESQLAAVTSWRFT